MPGGCSRGISNTWLYLEFAKLMCAFYLSVLDFAPQWFNFPDATVLVWVPDFTKAACFQQPFCTVINQHSFNILYL